MDKTPILYWMRRDFRLADNPALTACDGRPVIPVFIRNHSVDDLGAAPKFRLGRAIGHFAKLLEGKGGRLILRRGDALEVLRDLIRETGAGAVTWNRLYDGTARDRDAKVKKALKEDGLAAESHNAHLLFEPWTVETQAGGPYKVYSPFWRAVRDRDVAPPRRVPDLTWPGDWPESDRLEDWALEAEMYRGADVVAEHLLLGEEAARDRLVAFIDTRVTDYKDDRDRMDRDGTSNISEPLSYGEIGPRQCWQAGRRAMEQGSKGAETFLKELVWREFAYHLMFHFPRIDRDNWRAEWDDFPWRQDNNDAKRWKRGRTGLPIVDAAMRELYVTGRMHNRARMLVASYLTKHLMTDWRVGLRWFEDTLVDWDPASNAMGWQWVAGSGPDASPFFRIFNPETQAEKFDPDAAYRDHWLKGAGAEEFARAIPRSWPGDPKDPPPVGLKEGRERALRAYEDLKG